MAIFPIDLDIRDIEHPLECSSLERQTERVSDQTLCTVAADQVFGFDRFQFSVDVSYIGPHDALVLCKAFEFGSPSNIFAVRSNEFVKDLFMLALLDNEHVGIRTHASADLAKLYFAAYLAANHQPCL